jgi:hypothetical protein
MSYIANLIFIILMPNEDISREVIEKVPAQANTIREVKVEANDPINKKIAEIFKLKLNKDILKIKKMEGSHQPNAKIYKIEALDSKNKGKNTGIDAEIPKKYMIKFLVGGDWKEIKSNIFASKNGFGPKIYVAKHNPIKDQGYFIAEFLENEKITAEKRQDKKLYMALGDILKKIHGTPKESQNTHTWTIFDIFADRFQKLTSRGKISENAAKMHEIIKKQVQKMKIILESEYKGEYKITHNDLHQGNLRYQNGRFTAIDFADLAMGDPFYDLAKVINEFCIVTSTEKVLLFQDALLQQYFGRKPTDWELKKLSIMKKLDLLRIALDEELYEYKGKDEFMYTSDAPATEMRLARVLLEEGFKEGAPDYDRIIAFKNFD